MNSIGKKIDHIRQDLSYIEFSKAIEKKTGYEISPSSLHKYVTGQRKPSFKMLEIIATYANVPIASFFEENNEVYSKVKKLDQLKLLQKEYHELSKIKEIPIFDMNRVSPTLLENPPQTTLYYPLPVAVYGGEALAVRITDNAMSDMGIEPGDLVFGRKEESEPQIGKTILAKVKEDLICKRYYVKNNLIVLEPMDLKYKSLHPHELQMIGVVTKLIRDFE